MAHDDFKPDYRSEEERLRDDIAHAEETLESYKRSVIKWEGNLAYYKDRLNKLLKNK